LNANRYHNALLDTPEDRPARPHVSTPQTDQDADFRALFLDPPETHSPVPFYWWAGEKLERGRIAWQLDQRSRVWIEAFHSSGWGTQPAEVAAALCLVKKRGAFIDVEAFRVFQHSF
jgi:hypothetical protein